MELTESFHKVTYKAIELYVHQKLFYKVLIPVSSAKLSFDKRGATFMFGTPRNPFGTPNF